MAAVVDRETAPGRHHLRPDVAAPRRDLGESRQGVHRRDRLSQLLQPRRIAGDTGDQLGVEPALDRQPPLFGVQDPLLELLHLGRHVALGVGERLAAHVVGGHRRLIRARNLDRVAEDAVVAHLQGGDPGALALALFELEDVALGVRGERAVLVELGVDSGGDHPAVVETPRRLLLESAAVGRRRDRRADRGGGRGEQPAGESRELREERRHGGQGVAQQCGLARRERADDGAGRQALEIGDARQRAPQSGEQGRIGAERADAVVAVRDLRQLAQRAAQPVAQQAAAGGRDRAIEHREQRAPRSASRCVRRTSRLASVVASRTRRSVAARRRISVTWSSRLRWVDWAYASTAAAARTPGSPSSSPKPRSVPTPNCRASLSAAFAGDSRKPSSAVRQTTSRSAQAASSAGSPARSQSSSRGRSTSSSATASSGSRQRRRKKLPVETSRKAPAPPARPHLRRRPARRSRRGGSPPCSRGERARRSSPE